MQFKELCWNVSLSQHLYARGKRSDADIDCCPPAAGLRRGRYRGQPICVGAIRPLAPRKRGAALLRLRAIHTIAQNSFGGLIGGIFTPLSRNWLV
jgi:hypothetical protein